MSLSICAVIGIGFLITLYSLYGSISMDITRDFMDAMRTAITSSLISATDKMAELMNVKVLGLVENYSFYKCPCCGEETKIYGESSIDALANTYGVDVLAKLPIDPSLAKLCDRGEIELAPQNYLDIAADKIEELTK
jgi:predicted RNA-binding Zn-ribbon protein involved in translation (DUF1610 family)